VPLLEMKFCAAFAVWSKEPVVSRERCSVYVSMR
jgi:hypothetical protein